LPNIPPAPPASAWQSAIREESAIGKGQRAIGKGQSAIHQRNLIMARLDKNSEADRARRRLAATAQALQEGITGVEHFYKHTSDPAARKLCAQIIQRHVVHLGVLALQNPAP
jgi:hypothetical protein